MKLVELLAAKLEKWADTTVCYVQDPDGSVWPCKEIAYRDGAQWGGDHGLIDQKEDAKHFEEEHVCDDHDTAIVTKSQWQAERDRQKGGEWKRHRGGKQPVADEVKVDVRFKDGTIHPSERADFWEWRKDEADPVITAYRVISQPQAEEVEVIEPISTYKEFEVTGQWHQIDGPILWRDTVNEIDAYIEEFTRERESLINRLALEGFALIPAMAAVMGVADIDMSDWRNWKAGDVVECTHSDCNSVYTAGNYYKVTSVTSEYAKVSDDCGPASFCHINNDDNVKFTLYT